MMRFFSQNRDEFLCMARYLAVGIWNTLFGVGFYALLYRIWGGEVNYLALAVPSNIVAITNAYVCYKFFVFRTRGNVLREYFRCYAVYGAGALAGMALLWLLVRLFGLIPDVANAVGTLIVAAASYFGHRFFSFRGRLPQLECKHIFITGGTGFFGKSLLDWLRRNPVNGLRLSVLTRDPEAFRSSCPELAGLGFVKLVSGDVRDFVCEGSDVDFIIHAATTSGYPVPDAEMRSVVVDGTRRVLDFASSCPKLRRLLYVSSGAVYGIQEPDLERMGEDHACAPATVYAKSKLEAETLCAASGLDVVTARCFAFVGRYLPLDAHFAIGNFIGDCLAHRPITVKGDGTPYRSYLYADDLAEWLLTMLARGRRGGVYNLGSPDAVSVLELAGMAGTLLGGSPGIEVALPPSDAPAARYVPDVSRAERELGLKVRVNLAAAIIRTAAALRGAEQGRRWK